MAELRSGRGLLLGVGLITLGGGILRAATVGSQSLWFDELVTASLLRGGFVDMLHAIPSSERTPYLYYVLAWPTTRMLGDGEVGLRALSVVAGTLTIPAAFLAARELASRRVGLAAALLVAVNPMLVWYAQEARAYALLALLATVGLWLFARSLRRGERMSLAGWAVCSGLAIATHYFALFVVVPEVVVLAIRPELRRRALGWSIVPLVVLLVHAPLLGQQGGRSSAPIGDASLWARLVGTAKAAVVGFSAPAELLVALAGAVLAGVAVVLAVTRSQGRERSGGMLAGGLAFAAVGGATLLSLVGRDYLLARNLIVGVVPLLVLLAVGFVATRAGWVAGGVLVALSLVVAVAPVIEPVDGRTDWRGAADALGPSARRAIVVTPAMTPRYWQPYVPDLSEIEEPVIVDEIVVLGLATEGGFGAGAVTPPSAGSPAPPPGFEVATIEERPTFTLVRYRAARPTPVTPEELARLRLDEGTGRELLQPGLS